MRAEPTHLGAGHQLPAQVQVCGRHGHARAGPVPIAALAVCAQGHGGPKGWSATEAPQSAKGNAAADTTQFCWPAQKRASTGLSPGTLGSGACNDGRSANALHGRWCLPRIPPGASPALGLPPCRSVRYAAFVSGGGPGCRPRPWDGRSAPGAPTIWTGSDALTPPGRPRTDSFRNGDPAAQAGCKTSGAEHPVVNQRPAVVGPWR